MSTAYSVMRSCSVVLSALLAIAIGACGATIPSSELVRARSNYEEAEESQAKQLVPDKLLDARQALDRAERVFEDDGNSDEARTLAYIAGRKAQIAMALAEISAARKIREQAERDYQEELEVAQRRTHASLGETKSELEKARMTVSQQEQQLSAKEQELLRREKELREREQELQSEKKAREEAEKRAAAAMKSLQEIAQVQEDKRGLVITLSGAVLFKTNSASLLPIAEQQLEKVAAALADVDDSKMIRVEGHTDSRGSSSANRQLSSERAQSVRAFLVSQGLDPGRVVAFGMGEDRPIASNKSAEGRANNRRVEIIVGGSR